MWSASTGPSANTSLYRRTTRSIISALWSSSTRYPLSPLRDEQHFPEHPAVFFSRHELSRQCEACLCSCACNGEALAVCLVDLVHISCAKQLRVDLQLLLGILVLSDRSGKTIFQGLASTDTRHCEYCRGGYPCLRFGLGFDERGVGICGLGS